jgi:hypothetical protein
MWGLHAQFLYLVQVGYIPVQGGYIPEKIE